MRFNYAPNWADDLDLNMKPADIGSKEKIHFTFAGNIGKVQNLENIIMAFTGLSVEYQNKAQLNIIGDGSNLDNLKKIANLNSNIIFHGKKDRSDMGSYYQASDFLIISLINKPIFEVTVPAKTQTYIAAKKPILALINGDVADIVKDNNLGVCAEPSNINKIKEAFKRCIDMPDSQRSKFLINNDHLLKTTFNKEVIIDELKKKLIE